MKKNRVHFWSLSATLQLLGRHNHLLAHDNFFNVVTFTIWHFEKWISLTTLSLTHCSTSWLPNRPVDQELAIIKEWQTGIPSHHNVPIILLHHHWHWEYNNLPQLTRTFHQQLVWERLTDGGQQWQCETSMFSWFANHHVGHLRTETSVNSSFFHFAFQ